MRGDVGASVAFYARLGFEEVYRFPPEGEAGFFSLRLGATQLGVVSKDWPERELGITVGASPRGELWVYTEDVDRAVEELRAAGVPVLRDPQDMPWGERIAYVTDPDGNPVVLALRLGLTAGLVLEELAGDARHLVRAVLHIAGRHDFVASRRTSRGRSESGLVQSRCEPFAFRCGDVRRRR